MLSAILFAFSLEGVLPGPVTLRRPVPIVRFDRVREPRHRLNLRAIARLLGGHAPVGDAAADATAALDRGSRSAGTSTGWLGVWFTA